MKPWLCLCLFVFALHTGAFAAGGTIALLATTIVTSASHTPRANLAAQYAAPAALSSRGTQLLLVQFAGPLQEQWQLHVRAAGAIIHEYIPEHALLVECAPASVATLAQLPEVRWLGDYLPQYKQRPVNLATGTTTIWTIQTIWPDDAPRVADNVQARGGEILSVARGTQRGYVRARLAAAQIAHVATLAEVEWLEPCKPFVLCNDVAAQGPRLNMQPVWTSNLTGTGQIVGHADTGLDTGNLATMTPDFTNRIAYTMTYGRPGDWSDPDGHGTHTAGSLCGNGSMSSGQFKGTAFGAQLLHQSLLAPDGSLAVPSPIYNLFNAVYTNGARIHSDSFTQSGSLGDYNTYSRSVDEFMWNCPDLLVVFAAGNTGADYNDNGIIDNGSIESPGTAKNCLTVGAAESDRPAGSGGFSSMTWGAGGRYFANPIYTDLVSTPCNAGHPGLAAFSSRGPCDDGRIKPDVTAPGTDIVSCRSWAPGASFGWGMYDGFASNYVFYGGTSMATPLAAGCAALTRQFYQEHYLPAISNPSAALIKATLINGARSLSPGQYGWQRTREIYARPHFAEGWGQVNLAASLFPPPGCRLIAYDNLGMIFGSVYAFPLTITGTNKLCVTLAWSDWPGSIAAAKALVNDVDLFVILPSGVTNYPNGLTTADHLNNVEGIDIDPAPTGTYTIVITSYTIPHSPQKCALVMREDAPSGAAVMSIATNLVMAVPPNVSTGMSFVVNNLGASPLQFLCSWSWPDYYVATSDMAGGPAYAWIDIATNGTDTELGYDETTGLMPLGFGVNFFGRTNTQFSISANGVIGLSDGTVGHDNYYLPTSNGVPQQFIAPFWDNLDPTTGGSIKYVADGTQLIVTWLNVARKGTADRVTFQTIVRRDGKIMFQYHTMNGTTSSATIGLQDSYTGPVVRVAFNQAFVKNSFAVLLAPVLRWMNVSPAGGTVPPHSALPVWIAANSTLMEIEPYWQYMTVYNDSPGNPQLVKVTLDVVPEPLTGTGCLLSFIGLWQLSKAAHRR